MSIPTPETDAAQHEGLLRGNPMPTQVVHVNFARGMERERDEARSIAAELASVASYCLGWHNHESTDTAMKIAGALKRWKKSK